MKFVIKQSFVSIGDDFSILDENGNLRYFVDGYGFSIGNKLSFQDENRSQLALIKQSLFTFTPSYKIVREESTTTFRKKLISFRPKFVVKEAAQSAPIIITGRFIDFEYFFTQDGETIAVASKKWFRATDTYGIDIQGSADPVTILCSAIIIDLVLHNKK